MSQSSILDTSISEAQFFRKSEYYGLTAQVMENAVQRCQISDQEIWLLGLVSHEILTQLQNIMYNKQKIVFPSLIIGWKSKQKALTDLQSKVIDNNQQYNVVIFHIKGISALKSNFDWIFAYNANGFIKRMVSYD